MTMAETDSAWRPMLARGVRLTHDRVRDTDLLLMPEQVVVLNASAAAIVRRCSGDESPESMIAALRDEYDGDSLATDVQGFLAMARREGWVV
jgi:pyrroloquinoline quinone biosynthesis protein D